MDSRAKLFGHSIHQMLIAFPIGLLVTAVVFDIAALVGHAAGWFEISFWMILAGVVGGLLAAPFGLIDFLHIPKGTRARSVGLRHGLGNVVLLALFTASFLMRWDAPRQPETLALVLSFAGVALGVMTMWLGGELVDRLGVGVDTGANLNAPSSLSSRSTADLEDIEISAD
jgi:uncharacterized membrane protein